jgi:hypothetical protein
MFIKKTEWIYIDNERIRYFRRLKREKKIFLDTGNYCLLKRNKNTLPTEPPKHLDRTKCFTVSKKYTVRNERYPTVCRFKSSVA